MHLAGEGVQLMGLWNAMHALTHGAVQHMQQLVQRRPVIVLRLRTQDQGKGGFQTSLRMCGPNNYGNTCMLENSVNLSEHTLATWDSNKADNATNNTFRAELGQAMLHR